MHNRDRARLPLELPRRAQLLASRVMMPSPSQERTVVMLTRAMLQCARPGEEAGREEEVSGEAHQTNMDKSRTHGAQGP